MSIPRRIPILTYHALHAPGWDYDSNDHVALEADLGVIRMLGFRVVPLATIATALIEGRFNDLARERVVGISLDDGTDHDFVDFSHPAYGYLKSMARVLEEQGADLGYHGGQANATSFVIVSPQARTQLDRTCIAGRGQWRDDWWLEAARQGTLTIANHSWDHLHPTLDTVVATRASRGEFQTIASDEDAEREIGDAERFLRAHLGDLACGLFAYPYGRFSDFLVSEYLPRQSLVNAAFAGGGDYVAADSGRWTIPRFTCQEHWHTPAALAEILNRA